MLEDLLREAFTGLSYDFNIASHHLAVIIGFDLGREIHELDIEAILRGHELEIGKAFCVPCYIELNDQHNKRKGLR